MKKLFTILLITVYCLPASGQSSAVIDSLYRNSYKVFELQRLPNGMYRDSKLFSGTDYHPVSISNTGMGLIALCIADAMAWIPDAKDLAMVTLQTATGLHPDFIPDRTSNGYFRHFMDVNTGAQMWGSEYSTIDTDILMAGALFAEKYFQNDSISRYVTQLWNSIDFEAAISNPNTGKIYLSMNADGSGVASSLTSPYSEYMIVAWLTRNSSDLPASPGNILWDNYYSSPDFLPRIYYDGIEVLSDNNTSFLSSFTHQFNYYLCNYFTTSVKYNDFFNNAHEADKAWWNTATSDASEWGLGAGSAVTSPYRADAINNNPDTIISPHIIAGFLPVNSDGKNDLITMWNANKGKYLLPSAGYHPVLWRSSKSDASWIPNEIIGIDYSTMLFGLSTLPEYLGPNFFPVYNDFFLTGPTSVPFSGSYEEVYVYPNPSSRSIRASITTGTINYRICNASGREVLKGTVSENEQIDIQDLKPGPYFLIFEGQEAIHLIKN